MSFDSNICLVRLINEHRGWLKEGFLENDLFLKREFMFMCAVEGKYIDFIKSHIASMTPKHKEYVLWVLSCPNKNQIESLVFSFITSFNKSFPYVVRQKRIEEWRDKISYEWIIHILPEEWKNKISYEGGLFDVMTLLYNL